MKIRQVEVHVSRKVSRDYNSTEFSFGMTAELDFEEDPDIAMLTLREQLKNQVRAAFKKSGEEGNGG